MKRYLLLLVMLISTLVAVDAEMATLVAVDAEKTSTLVAVDAEMATLVAVDAETSILVAVDAETSTLVAVDAEKTSTLVAVDAETSTLVAVDAETSILVAVDAETSTLEAVEEKTLRIYHINDFLYDVFPIKDDNSTDCSQDITSCFGGLRRLSQLIDTNRAKNETDAILWLNAGNTIGGEKLPVLKFGIADTVKSLNFNALALGPEVFRYGLEPSEKYTTPLQDVSVATNLKNVPMNSTKLLPIGGDCFAAVVGFVDKVKTDEYGWNRIVVEEEKKAIEDEIKAIKQAETDKKILFIALGSSSIDKATDIASIPDIDLVLFSGGHFADEAENELSYFKTVQVTTATGNKTNYLASVIKDFGKLSERFLIGQIDILLTNECKVSSTVVPKHVVEDYLKNDESEDTLLISYLERELGVVNRQHSYVVRSKVNLYTKSCILSECSLGGFISDAIVAKVNALTPETTWSESVKIAVFPGSSITEQNTTGELTLQQLDNLVKEDEYIFSVKLSGKQLKQMFNIAFEKNSLNYLQVSGSIHVEYDYDRCQVTRVQTLSENMDLVDIDLNSDAILYPIALPSSMLHKAPAYEFMRTLDKQFYDATLSEALEEHVTGSAFLSLPPTGVRVTRKADPELCASNTGEVIILTLTTLVLIVGVLLLIWKVLIPKYRTRRGSSAHLIH